MMDINTLETLVKKALEYADHDCTFVFQGGESTLVGLEFYKKLIQFEEKYNIKKVRIINALQTNGVVIDAEWAKFLANNNFLVGLSLDGPKDIHDLHYFSKVFKKITNYSPSEYSKIYSTTTKK